MPRLSERRIQLIKGLEEHGGTLKANGRGFLERDEITDALGLPRLDTKTFSNFMGQAARSGVISIKKSGRKTKAIYLVHGKDEKDSPAATPGKKRGRKPQKMSLPVPTLGETLTVCVLAESPTGQITLGLRGENGTWQAEVQAFAG